MKLKVMFVFVSMRFLGKTLHWSPLGPIDIPLQETYFPPHRVNLFSSTSSSFYISLSILLFPLLFFGFLLPLLLILARHSSVAATMKSFNSSSCLECEREPD